MPKATSAFAEVDNGLKFPDEDEKTTIESSWEEEGSTTVEQGEVAEKIRSLNLQERRSITNVTSTSGQQLIDEPTVDDQRANAALSLITPPSVLARLIITQGNDSGQEIEIVPGKSYTIGRAIDNDVVLTDIAVSRKHFDLRNDDGVWVVVDRGSGNGTLVNGSVEDQPFRLANGDTIEIGNTTFRFDFPNGIPRNAFNEQGSTNGFDAAQTTNGAAFEIEDEEPSTVAAKPMSNQQAVQHHAQQAPLRPKTVPPPPLPRPRPPTRPPPQPLGMAQPTTYPVGSQGSVPMQALLAPTVAPHHNMQAMPQPMHPATLHAAHQGMLPMHHAPGTTLPMPGPTPTRQPAMLGDPMQLANVMPTTIPGQGRPVQPQPPHMQGLPFTYPNVADHQQHARMVVVSNQPGRNAPSTAHVPPTPFNGGLAMPSNAYAQPRRTEGWLSRRTKLMLGGAGLTLLAAIATIAIIKGVSGGKADAKTAPAPTPVPSKPTIQPIEPKADAKRTPTIDKTAKVDPKPEPKPEKVAKVEPPKPEPKPEPKPDPKPEPKPEKVAKVEPPKPEPKPEPKPVKVDPKPEKVAKVDPPKKDPPKKDPPKKDPPKKDPPKKDPPKKDPPPKRERPRVAVAEQPAGADVKGQAETMFRAKRFTEAAATLKSAASQRSGLDAQDLTNLAAMYSQFGRAYNAGMAPSTAPSQAWISLNQAKNYDRKDIFKDEIDAKLGAISGKAAMQFVGQKSFQKAKQAVQLAESTTGSNDSTKIVRGKIEDYAHELYDQATGELQSNPKAAKAKLQEIKTLVPSTSSWFGKATRQLATLP